GAAARKPGPAGLAGRPGGAGSEPTGTATRDGGAGDAAEGGAGSAEGADRGQPRVPAVAPDQERPRARCAARPAAAGGPPRDGGAVMRGALLVAMAWTGIALAAQPPAGEPPAGDDGQLRRELRIGADVFRSALSENLANDRRVVEVEAGYLAGQGVLVLVELTRPWLLRPDGVNPEIAHLEQIPEMVQDILSELRLGLNPRQAEDLQELRAIRDAQREVRAEQRELRARIREKRRELLRADAAAAESLRREIEELNRQLT